MRSVRAVLIFAALAALLVPLPPHLVETRYSTTIYPVLQSRVTAVTNLSPLALLDVAAVAIGLFLTFSFARRMRARGLSSAVAYSSVNVLTLTALIVLWFFVLWGANYRRLPLEEKLNYDQARVTRDAALRLGTHALGEVNGRYDAAHATLVQGPSLDAAFGAAQRALGASRLAIPGTPKRSLLELYFRAAAIDGMTDPFFLEVILNPDTLPFERPFVLSHEWAHLAGYANEGEANFVAWLTCSQGDAMAVYSGWMAIFEHVVAALPGADRVQLTSRLADGPRRDLQEAAARYSRSSPVVRTAARDVYDSYLRANRVPEGVESYSTVVRLMLGAGLEDGRRPVMR
jgi:hypothetical protein